MALATAASAAREPVHCGQVVIARLRAQQRRGGGAIARPHACPRAVFRMPYLVEGVPGMPGYQVLRGPEGILAMFRKQGAGRSRGRRMHAGKKTRSHR